MKISKTGLLGLSSLFTVMGLGLMAVSVADRQLDIDLNNAVQFMENVKFISSGSEYSTILSQVGSGSVKIQETNFILTQTGAGRENIILTGSFSSILGGEKNVISGGEVASGRNVIFGGSENFINGGYNVILGGEHNRVESGKITSVILGGRDNLVRGESVVVLGSNNTVENDGNNSRFSVVIGLSGYLKGNNSAALGSNSRVKANNSFLWSDGSAMEELTGDNLFVVMADNGMVINTNVAHSFAKLTLGGSFIISSAENDKNIKCGTGEGGGILKIVNAESHMCLCGCDGSGRNSMLGRGRCMSICDSSIKPECGTIVKRVCDDGQILFSGNCKMGKPVKGTGAYFMDKYDKVHWSCQTDDGSVTGCVASVANKSETFEGCEGYSCQGPVPGGAYLIEGSNVGLTGWVQNTLYPNESEAAGKKCAYVCDGNHKLSEDGKSCEELTYKCKGDEPGENTRKGPSATTNQALADSGWKFIDNPSADLGACEWSCDDSRKVKVDGENRCILPEQAECSSSHFRCEDGSEGTNTVTGNSEWTWKCGNTNCKECRTDLGFGEDENGNCVDCPYISLNITDITGCNVYFNVSAIAGGIPRPRYFTGTDFNQYFYLRYSVDGHGYTKRSHLESSSGYDNIVKLFSHGEAGQIYLKVQNRERSCFGPVESGIVSIQNCPTSCCSATLGKTFYNDACFRWDPSYIYSETGLALANLSGYYWYHREGSCPYCPAGVLDCVRIDGVCYYKTSDGWDGTHTAVCGGDGWIIPNAENIIGQIGLLSPYGIRKTVYIPSHDGKRCKSVLEGFGGGSHIKSVSSESHVGYLSCIH